MENFLTDSKESLATGKPVHVVLGNESCDLDSVVCGIVYAYYLKKVEASASVVAVVDCSPEELELRREVNALLKQLNIAVTSLSFSNDIDLIKLQDEERLRLTLVDHNVLANRWKALKPSVVEIIDHHKNAGEASAGVQSTIDMVGSCCTLVGEKILSADASLVTEEIALALLSAILLDTINLDAEAGRTTDKDREIADLLSQIVGQERAVEVFQKLRDVKFDVSDFTSAELLVKDYKPVPPTSSSSTRVGISSVTCSLEQLLTRSGVQDALSDFLKEKDVNCLVLMAIFFPEGDAKAARQVGVFSTDGEVRAQVTEALQSDDVLRLTPLETTTDSVNPICFNQGNRAASRKILLPLLACALAIGPSLSGPPLSPVEVLSDRMALLPDSDSTMDQVASPAAVIAIDMEASARPITPIEVYTAGAEADEERAFRAVGVDGIPSTVDMKAIEDFRRVVSHGGYERASKNAIIVLSTRYLPSKSIKNYNYVMEQLFLYVISTVQHLAVENYCIVLFNTLANHNNTPGILWLRKYYAGIDRSLRKNLQNLYIYNPTMRLKVVFQLARPFISTKFWRKVSYVQNLNDLQNRIPLEGIDVPEDILKADASHEPIMHQSVDTASKSSTADE